MILLENDFLRIGVNTLGAELKSIITKEDGLEYIWQADPAFWPKSSPVLFPVVGGLKANTYYFLDQPYHLNKHGFAREMEFELTDRSDHSLRFTLRSNDHTLSMFPFPFEFQLIYQLDTRRVSVTYKVINTGNDRMYFSVGAHPAFRLPLVSESAYQDYYLQFEQEEELKRWPISADGLIEAEPVLMNHSTRTLQLNKPLFYKDALVFKHLKSRSLKLLSTSSDRGLEFDFPDFPYLGIWAFREADFVCIEPWCGIADSVNSQQHLVDKEGILDIESDETFERTWSVNVF